MKIIFISMMLLLLVTSYPMTKPNQPISSPQSQRIKIPAKILEIIVIEDNEQELIRQINKLYKDDKQIYHFMKDPENMDAVIGHINRKTKIIPLVIGLALGYPAYEWVKKQYKDNEQFRVQIKEYLDTAFKNHGLHQIQNAVRAIPELAQFVFADGNNTTMLLRAIPYVDAKNLVQELIEKGADVHKANAEGITPIMLAATLNRVEMLVLLLATGAEVNNSSGKSPALLAAIKHGAIQAVALLLDSGAIINDEAINLAHNAKDVFISEKIGALLEEKKKNPYKKLYAPLLEKIL